MKKVLVVAYTLPPIGGAGVQRPTKFIKYLRRHGWEPVGLTVKNPSVPVYDDSLVNEIPEDVIIYKAKTFEPSYASKVTGSGDSSKGGFMAKVKSAIKSMAYLVLIPDAQVLWWPGLIFSMTKIILKERPSCVFVTAPPFSSLVIVTFMSKLLSVPVVVDFRDEWGFLRANLENSKKTTLLKKIDLYLERYVVTRSAAFVGVTRRYVESILERHSMVDSEKGRVINNGFDEEDFNINVEKRESSKISIVYTGTVWKATSLENTIGALKILFNKSPQLRDHICVKIIGRIVDSEKDYFSDDDVKDNIEILGYKSHDDVIKEIKCADVLLLTLSRLSASDRIVPGKLYEYMATGNHILALIPDGETKEILEENYSNLTLAPPDNLSKIELAISNAITCPKESDHSGTISNFERSELTRKLSEIFDSISI